MSRHFPLEFTLESGTKVTVTKESADTYDFSLRPTHGRPATQFTYVDDGRPKAEWDEKLDFQQLEALRHFWVMTEDVL